jgi:hypothetical protein
MRQVYRLRYAAALLFATTATAIAQVPSWTLAQGGATSQTGSTAQASATTVDGRGNVLVAGYFTGQLTLGTTTLTSAGGQDLFIAKWLPATSTWAWAQRGGGSGADQAQGIAVSGSGVYVTGYLTNTIDNAASVTLSSTPVSGASATSSPDLVVAKYTDAGSSSTLSWVQVGGGTGADRGSAVAVNGSNIYVTGSITNTTANASSVVFGANVPQSGASPTSSLDLVLAKYTEASDGNSAAFGWSQVGGGSGADEGQGLSVHNAALYVTGYLTNNRTNSNAVVFGGSGTTAGTRSQFGANPNGTPSNDLVLARYTDAGSSSSFGWSQVAGGNGVDQGFGVAVNGLNVYVTGVITNSFGNTTKVVFGGTGTTVGTAAQYGATTTNTADLVLAKYTEATDGSSAAFGWSQVGGGNANDATQTMSDVGQALVVSGTSIYVTGTLTNSSTNSTGALFGGTGTTQGTASQNGSSTTSSKDVLVGKYTDNGSTAALNWTQIGGGAGPDQGLGLALVNSEVYVTGSVVPAATFGSLSISSPADVNTLFLGRLGTASTSNATPTPLPVTLTSFSVTAAGPTARIVWATAAETNSARFEVERSRDGNTFSMIGTLAATGNSNATHVYQLLDDKLPAGPGLYYYRLRQVDLDGTVNYSPVRAVTLARNDSGLVLYPNPTNSLTTLSGATPGTEVQVLDALGRLLLSCPTTTAGTAELSLPAGLTSGVYVVRVGGVSTRLLVK